MKYAIIHINDRCMDNINHNREVLSNWDYINDIQYFNGISGNAKDVLNHKKIKTDVWLPYDGRSTDPLPGEIGIWLTTLNIFQYISDNNIDELLVFEDDVLIDKDFIDNFNKCYSDLPKSYDFLSLYYFEGQNYTDERTLIESDYIHKSLNQYSGGQAILYSNKGAKKLLRAMKRKGLEYTSDCFIFKQSHIDVVEGYSLLPTSKQMVYHDNKNIKSTIDPENIRNT